MIAQTLTNHRSEGLLRLAPSSSELFDLCAWRNAPPRAGSLLASTPQIPESYVFPIARSNRAAQALRALRQQFASVCQTIPLLESSRAARTLNHDHAHPSRH